MEEAVESPPHQQGQANSLKSARKPPKRLSCRELPIRGWGQARRMPVLTFDKHLPPPAADIEDHANKGDVEVWHTMTIGPGCR